MKKKILLVATVILISVGLLSITKIVQDKYLNKNTAALQQEEKDSKSAEVVVKEKDIQEQTVKVETLKDDAKPEVKEQETKAIVENKTTDTKTTSTENVVVEKKEVVVVKKDIPPKAPEPKKEPVKKPNLIIKDDISGKIILSVYVNIENKTVADITRNELGNNYAASGRGESTYVTRMYDLKVRGSGPLSGWCYYVNGVKPGVSCGAYTLKFGDIVEWKYLEDGVNN
ncbi:DUF4430 domain-containing protein [Clostridium sp.]|uniref:DUF4430 domain-containing protein n=1 Tax=Clostridium sp. TaxID=1506 RepID=UPI001A5B423B|nr:DUF4430 domain-containing protein [Clostridium sp.]MBK5240120.1 DUF4430 domain-containing protein [Clostridium sp.]